MTRITLFAIRLFLRSYGCELFGNRLFFLSSSLLLRRLIGQLYRDLAHIHLAGDNIGDEPLAGFAQQFDFPACDGDGGIELGGLGVEVFDDGGLFGEGGEEAHRIGQACCG
ncbi:hypothetical protein Cabther_B0511 [Chloracidobacterium thermophilum B]|uniref:Uncharacterized protein n=1 Tax=Chloracidobacterium thermophilum (strain B) TaxID=981222 RepID=G2LLU7_CHLTF|nr:hypothetical protein Cabther_B0511 [Chloracidobacterium thermophilum B]